MQQDHDVTWNELPKYIIEFLKIQSIIEKNVYLIVNLKDKANCIFWKMNKNTRVGN